MTWAYGLLPGWAQAVFSVSLGAFLLGELVQAFRLRRGAKSADRLAEVVFRALFFAAVLIVPLGKAAVSQASIGGGLWTFGAGAVVTWLGILLRWWSFVTLGRYFTVVMRTREDQPVIDRGPYRFLRHPSYSGLLLVFVGVGLMVGNWVSTVGGAVVILGALIYRIRVEERALTEALGEKYAAFAKGRARLVPYVW